MNRKPQYRFLVAGALVALVLRASIPAGFMPSMAKDGLLFEMCPSAVPAAILAAMSGAGNHHGAGHHHGHEPGGASKHFDTGSCPIGQSLSYAAAVDEFAFGDIPPAAAVLNATRPGVLHSFDQPRRRSRDPPA